MSAEYIHGTEPDEQSRLERLNHWMNRRCIEAMTLKEGDRVIDFGSGLGGLTQMMAEVVGVGGRVVGIERSLEQIAVAENRCATSHGAGKSEYRAGSVEDPPLEQHEWGCFDMAHARFVLQHVECPARVVENMVRSVRHSGRIVLADDDHSLFKHWPECPGLDTIWTAYQRAFERNGNDSIVGRRLVQLLHEAGARPVQNHLLFFGSCSGSQEWVAAVDNLVGVLQSARSRMVQWALIDEATVEAAFHAIESWRIRSDAAIWYAMSWAEGVKPE